MKRNRESLAIILLLAFFLIGCGPPPLEESEILGVWISPELNDAWQFFEDRTFDNERGTEGAWSLDGQSLIVTATNQGDNPSTWILVLTDSMHLEGTWSDPYGNNGRLMLEKQ